MPFDALFTEYSDYVSANRLLTVYPVNSVLARWVSATLPRLYRKGSLTKEQLARLGGIGYQFGEYGPWRANIEKLREFYQEFGRMPGHLAAEQNARTWLNLQYVAYAQGKLTDEQADLLRTLGCDPAWRPTLINDFKRIDELREYKAKFGVAHVRQGKDAGEYRDLALWLTTARIRCRGPYFRQKQLGQEAMQALSQLGVSLSMVREQQWKRMCARAAKLFAEYPTGKVPVGVLKRRGLTAWVNRQRRDKANHTLSEAREAQLTALGFVWVPTESTYTRYVNELVAKLRYLEQVPNVFEGKLKLDCEHSYIYVSAVQSLFAQGCPGLAADDILRLARLKTNTSISGSGLLFNCRYAKACEMAQLPKAELATHPLLHAMAKWVKRNAGNYAARGYVLPASLEGITKSVVHWRKSLLAARGMVRLPHTAGIVPRKVDELTDLGLPVRAVNGLHRSGIYSRDDLRNADLSQFHLTPNVGVGTVASVARVVRQLQAQARG